MMPYSPPTTQPSPCTASTVRQYGHGIFVCCNIYGTGDDNSPVVFRHRQSRLDKAFRAHRGFLEMQVFYRPAGEACGLDTVTRQHA